jgi:hypothetical protein
LIGYGFYFWTGNFVRSKWKPEKNCGLATIRSIFSGKNSRHPAFFFVIGSCSVNLWNRIKLCMWIFYKYIKKKNPIGAPLTNMAATGNSCFRLVNF